MAENPSTGEIQCRSFQKIVPNSQVAESWLRSGLRLWRRQSGYHPKSFIFSVLRLHEKAVTKRNVSMEIKLLCGKSPGPPRD